MSQSITKFHRAPTTATWQGRVGQMWHRVGAAWREAATHRQLAQLDDHGLADIGMSRAQVQFEVERPVWALVPGNQR